MIRQVARGYFQPVHIHSHTGSPLIEVNVSAREEMKRLSFVKKQNFFRVFNEILHVSNLHTDLLLSSVILPQQNDEFQFVCAILCQNLIAV